MPLPLASSKETLVWLFVYATSALKLLFFVSFLLFAFAFKLFSSLFWPSHEYDYGELYEEEEDMPEVVAATEEEEGFGYYSNFHREHVHLVAEVLKGGEGLVFLPQSVVSRSSSSTDDSSQFEEPNESFQVGYLSEEGVEEEEEDGVVVEEETTDEEEEDGFVVEEEAVVEEEVIVEDITGREDSYLDEEFETDRDLYKHKCPSPITIELGKKQDSSATNTQLSQGERKKRSVEFEHKEVEAAKLSRDEEFLNYAAPRVETKKQFVSNITQQDHQRRHGVVDEHEDEPYADSCTVGSTSKGSSDWRSSITFRDSCTDDPFSSSRRSCLKWESYTVFQKYDEEMMLLDRISAHKLHEAESLKSLKVQPRSISQRIVHQFTTTTISKNVSSDGFHHNNPYYELEAAYVAQVCLAWEALSWDYINFSRKQALQKQQGITSDLGCPAQLAQDFQRFLVLLQRYIETEPYEYGKRPEVYARMRRSVAPKLLLVPEYQDYEDEQKEQQAPSSRIPSASFRDIIEDSIRTFMNFLSADREKPYHSLLKTLFRRKKRGSVDPALVKVLKKLNTKKKLKLKELKRGGKCMRKKKLTGEEEMVILMGQIDLKLVSRVLRMWDLTRDQLRWCEEKMTKLTLTKQGKLHRDSTPLFFPGH